MLFSESYPAVKLKFFNWTDYNLEKLEYYKKLGFTHAAVHVDFDKSLYSHASGKWIYNKKKYAEGTPAADFSNHLKQVRDAGLIPIPIIECFSHTEAYIELDNTLPDSERSISQFNTTYPMPDLAELAVIFPCTKNWDTNSQRGYQSYDGIAYPGGLGENKGADEIYEQLFKIIKQNWGNTAIPYIHIGHDEWGYGCVSYLKLGRSKSRSESISELMAKEVHARITQIESTIGKDTKIIMWADGFVLGDYGETYGTAGELTTGSGGILNLLDKTYRAKNKIILMPWIYSVVDGTFDNGRNLTFDKAKQIAYLDRLGYNYIPCGGEDGDPSIESVEKVKQTTFEWVRVSQIYPKYLIGYGNATWKPYTNSIGSDTNKISVGYSAPLIAYLGWTYGERSLKLARNKKYTPDIFSKVKFIKSRQEQKWTEGVHYFSP